MSDAFAHDGGTLSLEVSGNAANIDFVDLIKETTVGVSNEPVETPSGFALSQNYPNPFNPSTNINFTLPVASDVQLTVYNLLGQKVATLVDDSRTAGNHTVRFDARSLASGVYFYQLKAGEFTLQRRMTLIK
ncbi:MAG: T9SS C-terminal target domain-containing protein [Balneola sp.]|nr:MAG: T9SS C-terminal target domain-containing protein [Balneola sp.]